VRHALRVDDNQPAIVEALRAAGVKVEIVGRPLDLLCAVKRGSRYETLLIEVKDEDGRFTKVQAEFMAAWPGEVHICRTPEEALRAAFGEMMR